MSEQLRPLRRIAVAAHPQLRKSQSEAIKVADFLNQLGLQAEPGLLTDEALRQQVARGEFDMLIAIGGDGTMLRAGHLCGPAGVPVLGINMGKFGFLTELQNEEWRQSLPRLVRGDYREEHRMMLCAQHWREENKMHEWQLLNEVVVSRGHYVRPIHLEAYVDNQLLTTYVADGLIAATPTGSTAYSMAAGGPILPPELRNILLVAVAPHLSVDRAIVLAEGSSVSIRVFTQHDAVVSADGQAPFALRSDDRVEAFASDYSVRFVRFQDPGYFYRNLTPHMKQNPSTGNHR